MIDQASELTVEFNENSHILSQVLWAVEVESCSMGRQISTENSSGPSM